MPIVYILDNKGSKINQKVWAKQAATVLDSEVKITGLILGTSPKEELMSWMRTLGPQDVVITDGNKNGEDFIDKDFLACLEAINPSTTHFMLLSADPERVKNFQKQIDEMGQKDFTLYASQSMQLSEYLKTHALPARAKKRRHAEISGLPEEDPRPHKASTPVDLPVNVVKTGMAAMLWNSAPVPPLPSAEEGMNHSQEEQNTSEKKSGVTTGTV